jgi:predicted nicotinamide N-methyase
MFDTPKVVQDKRVLDFGSGGGLAAIAAKKCGASHVVACDIDPLALVAQGMNAQLNDVSFDTTCDDLVDVELDGLGVDLVLAGDVCYEREHAERITPWLRRQVTRGREVLLADPGRHYVPSEGLELLATYDVPVLHELESVAHKRTRLWRIAPG